MKRQSEREREEIEKRRGTAKERKSDKKKNNNKKQQQLAIVRRKLFSFGIFDVEHILEFQAINSILAFFTS